MAVPSAVAQALNAAAPSLAYNRLRLDALGSLEADNNGVTTNGGGNFLNNAGTTRVVGDVVIYDTSGDDRFTTTTTIADGRVLGVVNDASVVNAVRGSVQTRGPATVNVTGSVSRGDYLVTSATVGLAQSNGPGARSGVFAVALEANSGGTVVALLFGAAIFSPPTNQLVNGGFEVWQRGNGAFTASLAYTSDRWQISLAGTDTLSVSKEASNIDAANGGLAAAACTFVLGTGAGGTTLKQRVAVNLSGEGVGLRGRVIAFSIRARTATASAVKAGVVSDGTGAALVASGFHSGTGLFQTLTVLYSVPVDATYVEVQCNFIASATVYMDGAMLVPGGVVYDYYPLHPADELARCQRYCYVIPGTAVNDNVGGGLCTSTSAWQCHFGLPTMGGTPTITLLAAANFAVTNATGGPVAANTIGTGTVTARGVVLTGTVAGTPLVAGNATRFLCNATTGNLVLAEWNP